MDVGKQPPDHVFDDADEPEFRRAVSHLLQSGASEIRGMSETEYIKRCRALWRDCASQIDDVFRTRLLIDTKLPTHGAPTRRFERPGWPREAPAERSEPRPEWGDLYCCVVGLMDIRSGEFIDAPAGYRPPPDDGTSRRVVMTAGEKRPEAALQLDSPEPRAYAIAFLDILGFKKLLEDRGLPETRALYDRLINVAVKPIAESGMTPFLHAWGDGRLSPGLLWLPVGHAHFSDSILLWTPLYPEHISLFLERCIEVFAEALLMRVPLRGAIAFGEAVLDRPTSTFLGQPIIEVVQLEKAQDWTGVVVAPPPQHLADSVPLSGHVVIPCNAPLKATQEAKGAAPPEGLLVLDWPRRWRGSMKDSAVEHLLRMQVRGFEKYYENAAKFAAVSNENADWFLSDGPST